MKKELIVEKALKNGVTSENIGELFDIDDMMCLYEMKYLLNDFALETTLYRFTSICDTPKVYQMYLKSISDKELKKKQEIENILIDFFSKIPDEIIDFIVGFFADVLNNDYEKIYEKYNKIKDSQKCLELIEKLKKEINFSNPIERTNIIQYFKRQYSCTYDYYYTDLISNITGSQIFGLLYIVYGDIGLDSSTHQ